jgi:hypothetical protein
VKPHSLRVHARAASRDDLRAVILPSKKPRAYRAPGSRGIDGRPQDFLKTARIRGTFSGRLRDTSSYGGRSAPVRSVPVRAFEETPAQARRSGRRRRLRRTSLKAGRTGPPKATARRPPYGVTTNRPLGPVWHSTRAALGPCRFSLPVSRAFAPYVVYGGARGEGGRRGDPLREASAGRGDAEREEGERATGNGEPQEGTFGREPQARAQKGDVEGTDSGASEILPTEPNSRLA